MTIWFETDDLLVHFDWNLYPTGIQRVALAILAEVRALGGDRIGLCRLSRHSGHLVAISEATLLAQCAAAPLHRASVPWRMLRFLARHPARRLRDHLRGAADERALAARIAPGDVVVCLGLPWKNPDYGRRMAAAKRRYGVRFALMIYDVLPLSDPRFFTPPFIASFVRWFDAVIPVCDTVLVASRHVAAAVRSACAARGIAPPVIAVVPFGAGFAVPAVEISPPPRVPEPFVLYVSTLGGRKNHALLLRVWRRLIDKHGAENMPALVFVGTGGGRPETERGIAAAGLRGKVMVAATVDDAALGEMYRRCLFTVYPSFTEGWGLPIAESLMHGKFCVASHGGPLTEVAGDLIDYFDPADDDDATAKIERALFDPAYRDARTSRTVAAYRAPRWRDCADAVLRAVEAPADGSAA